MLVAVELALESGRPSGDHVLNILARLKSPSQRPNDVVRTAITLKVEPLAYVRRYEWLRVARNEEDGHVE
ncbi:hypothetical protein PQR51_28755 [Caballeronia grimmiae]